MCQRKLMSLYDALILYRNPAMDTLRIDRKILFRANNELIQKYLKRVQEVAAKYDKKEGAVQKRMTKMNVNFEEILKP